MKERGTKVAAKMLHEREREAERQISYAREGRVSSIREVVFPKRGKVAA